MLQGEGRYKPSSTNLQISVAGPKTLTWLQASRKDRNYRNYPKNKSELGSRNHTRDIEIRNVRKYRNYRIDNSTEIVQEDKK